MTCRWPGGYEQAALKMGYPGEIGGVFGSSTDEVGLRIVAGYPTKLETNLKPDDMCERITANHPISDEHCLIEWVIHG